MSLQDTQTSNWYFSDLKLITSHFHNHGLSIIFFFILILLVAFFFFYFVCKFNFFSTEILNSSPDANAVLVQINKGLDQETIQKLPVFLFSEPICKLNSVKESDECPICLGLFGDDEMVKLLPNCEHVYHAQCIDEWLVDHSNCPLCRASLQLSSSITSLEVAAWIASTIKKYWSPNELCFISFCLVSCTVPICRIYSCFDINTI